MVGMLVFRFGGQAITFLIIALLARNLGPEQFGLYSTLTIFISFCAILLTPSLNDLLIRETLNSQIFAKSGEGTIANALSIGYGLRISLAIISFTIAILVGPLLGLEGLNIGLFAIAGVSLFTSLTTPSVRAAYDVPLQLDYRMDRAAAINFAGRAILLSALATGIILHANLTGIITSQIIGEVVAFALLLFLLNHSHYTIAPSFKLYEIKAIALLAAPLILAEAFTVTYTRLDVLLLNLFIDAREAGIFAGPLRIIDGLQIIPTVFLGTLIPVLNRLRNQSDESFKRSISLSARALWLLGIICAVSIAPFSDIIIKAFLGAEFGDSTILLKIGVFCAPLIFVGTLIPAILIVQGKPNLIALFYFFLAVISICLNLILIPKYGATGAIYAKLITYAAIYPLTLIWIASRYICWTLVSQGVIPFALSIFASYHLQRLNLPMIWGLPAILLLCLALIWYTGWFGRKQLSELKDLFTGRTSAELN